MVTDIIHDQLKKKLGYQESFKGVRRLRLKLLKRTYLYHNNNITNEQVFKTSKVISSLK